MIYHLLSLPSIKVRLSRYLDGKRVDDHYFSLECRNIHRRFQSLVQSKFRDQREGREVACYRCLMPNGSIHSRKYRMLSPRCNIGKLQPPSSPSFLTISSCRTFHDLVIFRFGWWLVTPPRSTPLPSPTFHLIIQRPQPPSMRASISSRRVNRRAALLVAARARAFPSAVSFHYPRP